MKIYVGHSSSFNYKKDLYQPLRDSDLNEEHNIVLPHEDSEQPFNSKSYLKNECDIFIAEVSKASTGLGIELGWADIYDIPVICVYQKGSKPSGSIPEVSGKIESYQNTEELVQVIKKSIRTE